MHHHGVLGQQRLPRVKAAMNELMLARASDDVLKDVLVDGSIGIVTPKVFLMLRKIFPDCKQAFNT